jgi:hypothetical protein
MTQHFHIAERCEHGETKRHLCDHRLEWSKWRVRQVPCEPSFCPHIAANPPERFTRPERLAVVPDYLVSMAAQNVSALVDHDGRRAEEVVRRVLAVLRLAAPDMPQTPVYHYPDGSPTDEPIGASSGARCPWGKLRRGGDVVMCALDEDHPDTGDPGPGHTRPREHAFRLPDSGEYYPFHEGDPRAFNASTWMGETAEQVWQHTELRNSPPTD